MRVHLGRVTVLLLAAASLAAQAPTLKQANEYFQAKEWRKAAEAYGALVAREKSNARAWLYLGIARRHLEDYEGALAAFEQVRELGFARAAVNFQTSLTYARAGENEKALAWLEQAVEAGFGQPQELETRQAFASLRGDKRFQALVQRARINARPCEHLDEYRQFDFWVGEWDVYNPQGRQVGTNRIEKTAGGCVLWENWKSASGQTGKSMNYYDHTSGEWVQVWVDESADILPARGGFRDGAMRLTGTHYRRDSTRELYRGTWTPLEDGRVRQLLEKSRDGGESWYVWFEGYYRRKTAQQ